VDRDAVHAFHDAVALPAATRGRREDLYLVSALDQVGCQVMRLDLDTPQPREITVREQRHLHGLEPAMRQDGG
jgi:hypothetical protein